MCLARVLPTKEPGPPGDESPEGPGREKKKEERFTYRETPGVT